jgi:hypothetical protein
MSEDIIALELMLNRFRKLMAEILRGSIPRTTFQPWEVDILLDMQTCAIDSRRRGDILRQYHKAVEKQLETGPGPPMKLSEYIQLRMTRRPKIA